MAGVMRWGPPVAIDSYRSPQAAVSVDDLTSNFRLGESMSGSSLPGEFVGYIEQLAETRKQTPDEFAESIRRYLHVFVARARTAIASTSAVTFRKVEEALTALPAAGIEPGPSLSRYVALESTLGIELHAHTCNPRPEGLVVRGAIVLPGEAADPERIRAFMLFPLEGACCFITWDRFERAVLQGSGEAAHPFPIHRVELRALGEGAN